MLPDDSVSEVGHSHSPAVSRAALLFSVAQNEKIETNGNKETEAEAAQ